MFLLPFAESSEARESRSRYMSGATGAMGSSSYITRASADRGAGATDTYAKRYNYRSRSDVGSPRRYASQTLLDGARPGPSTPHAKRDALYTLQRELDTLSRSPEGAAGSRHGTLGYGSDVGGGASSASVAYDTIRSRAAGAGGATTTGRGFSNFDYDTYSASRREESSAAAAGGASSSSATTAVRYPGGNVGASASALGASGAAASSSSRTQQHEWPDNLMDIVHEPMDRTMERIRKYSTSTANVEGGSTAGEIEKVEEKYHREYREEHSSGR